MELTLSTGEQEPYMSAITGGHLRSLALLEDSDALCQTARLYRDALGGTNIYLRPTDNGLTVLVLGGESPKFIGAGKLARLPPSEETVANNVAEFEQKLAGASGTKPEEQFSMRLVNSALGAQLQLPDSDLIFVCQEWRFPDGKKLDILAVDPSNGQFVIVELKKNDDAIDKAVQQVLGYLDYFGAHSAELVDYFTRLWSAMRSTYDDISRWSDLEIDPALNPRAEVWWPEGRQVITPSADEIGPQVSSDPPFVARLRLHQSWWRAERLEVPWGTGPTPNATRELGNMLRSAEADTGANFLTPEIHLVAKARIEEGPGVEPFRCTHNLLSSQPMCFNLFGPLVHDHELALELLRHLLPIEVRQITDVRIEYSPSPIEEYLGDRTAFDAFVEFVDADGEKGFIGIETKLSEPFSQKVYDTPRYRKLAEATNSPWSGSPHNLADKQWNQLWRNQLLVEATRHHPAKPHGRRGWLAVAYHPADPTIEATIKGYRGFLADQSALLDWPFDRILDAFHAASDAVVQPWLNDFADRYLSLHLSEGLTDH